MSSDSHVGRKLLTGTLVVEPGDDFKEIAEGARKIGCEVSDGTTAGTLRVKGRRMTLILLCSWMEVRSMKAKETPDAR